MAQTFKGEVAFIDTREIVSKKNGRKYKAYSIKLKLDDGNLSDKLDCGFDPPKGINKGDYVEAVAEENNGYLKLQSFSQVERPAQRTAPAQTSSTTSTSTSDGPPGAVDRQTQIVLQHSQEIAVREVALLLANDALPLSSATTKAGQAKRYEEITKQVEKLTVQRYFDVVSARLLDSVADAGDVELQQAVGEIPPASKDSTATTGEDD